MLFRCSSSNFNFAAYLGRIAGVDGLQFVVNDGWSVVADDDEDDDFDDEDLFEDDDEDDDDGDIWQLAGAGAARVEAPSAAGGSKAQQAAKAAPPPQALASIPRHVLRELERQQQEVSGMPTHLVDGHAYQHAAANLADGHAYQHAAARLLDGHLRPEQLCCPGRGGVGWGGWLWVGGVVSGGG